MSNTNFCSATPTEVISKFEKEPRLKELFPNLYKQIIAQSDGAYAAYPQTYVLDDKAATEFNSFKNHTTERNLRDDYSFSGYVGSLQSASGTRRKNR